VRQWLRGILQKQIKWKYIAVKWLYEIACYRLYNGNNLMAKCFITCKRGSDLKWFTKSSWNRFIWDGSSCGQNKYICPFSNYRPTLPYLCSCMPLQTRWINRFARSNDAVWIKNVPFDGGVNKKLHLGSLKSTNTPSFTPNAEFPAKSIHSNNFWTVGAGA
jgi:hypothetical protein